MATIRKNSFQLIGFCEFRVLPFWRFYGLNTVNSEKEVGLCVKETSPLLLSDRCQRHNYCHLVRYICRLFVPCLHTFVAFTAPVGDEAPTLAELVPQFINSALQDHKNFSTSAFLTGQELNQQLFLPAEHNKHYLCPFCPTKTNFPVWKTGAYVRLVCGSEFLIY